MQGISRAFGASISRRTAGGGCIGGGGGGGGAGGHGNVRGEEAGEEQQRARTHRVAVGHWWSIGMPGFYVQPLYRARPAVRMCSWIRKQVNLMALCGSRALWASHAEWAVSRSAGREQLRTWLKGLRPFRSFI